MNNEVKMINGYMIKDEISRNLSQNNKDDITDIKSVVKFHSIAKSSATYITEFPNGKKLIIDTGLASQWEDIKTAIDNLGITKFDYVVITHFHPDHGGNIQNLIDNYDVSNAQWFVQMKPDYINHADDIADSESQYDTYISRITQNNINPIVPENDSYIIIDENIKLHFLNTSSVLAENYYNTNSEWYDNGKPNFNAFSLVTEIIHKNVRILSTGDLERPTEEQITPFLQKCNVITMPHHGINRDSYRPFYTATMPDYSIAEYIDGTIENTPNDWVRTEFSSFMTLKELNSKIITAKWSKPVNGLFTFISNGYIVNSNVLDGGLSQNAVREHKIYSRPDELISFATQLRSDVTLEQFIANMNTGSYYQSIIGSAFENRYPELYEDLTDIFGDFLTTRSKLEIYRDSSVTTACTIRIYNDQNEFTAYRVGNEPWRLKGQGRLSNITGITNLINLLKSLPQGFYDIPSYTDDEGTVLVTNGGYQLNVTVDYNSGTYVQASILATLRYTQTGACNVASGYFNTNDSNHPYIWRKLV